MTHATGATGKERPILFSAPMIRAILAGQKSMTRRIVKPVRGFEHHNICKPDMMADPWSVWWHGDETDRVGCAQDCPFGKPGDRLWVREQIYQPDAAPWCYKADNQPVLVDPKDETAMLVWAHHKQLDYCVSIHMPRWASRITLEITAVRVERVQEIPEEDAIAEGMREPSLCDLGGELAQAAWSERQVFSRLWKKINGPESWDVNSWVWVISFKRLGGAHAE